MSTDREKKVDGETGIILQYWNKVESVKKTEHNMKLKWNKKDFRFASRVLKNTF
jgi:hypothetical protein